MLDLIEIELTQIRRMAEQAADSFLLYLIDMAILEAKHNARHSKDVLERPNVQSLKRDPAQDEERDPAQDED